MISFNIASIIMGSGWIILAQAADSSKVSELGGWGVACVGLITLWKELKAERAKSDQRHEKQIKYTEECTAILQQLNGKKCSRCKDD